MERRLAILCVAVIVGLVGPVTALAQVTDLMVTKSGNDAVFSWGTGTASFTVGASNGDPRFSSGQTLATGLSAGPYTYQGAMTNGASLQFFDVSGQGDTSPLGNYTGGATPPPVPTISSVSPTTGLKVGDTLTINGSGFSTIASEDVVYFPEGVKATATGTPTATSFQVVIPRGALSGPIWVQVGHQVSSSSSLVILIQNGFGHLSGVAYQPTTKDIWLSDRGLGTSYHTRIVQLTFGATAWGKTESEDSGNGTFKYQGAQGFDSGQNWYYGLAESEINGGTRKKATSPPAGATAFTQVKPGSNDSVQVLAVATNPSLTDTAFFAYNDVTTGEKHIRKIAGSGVLDTDYGNFGATNLGFNSLAGLVFDQAGNLYDTESSQVRKITPSESSTIVATGLTTAFGIAHDQVNSSDAGMLLVSDFGAGALVAVDLSQGTATKATVASGLSLPRAASFAVTPLNTTTCGGLTNIGLSFVAIGEDTQVRQVPDPRLSLTPSGPTRVWISKRRADDAYPSSYQSADHQITITATMTPAPTTTQRTVCFRVVDAPDSASYSDGTTTGFWCDNKDPGTSNNAGKLWDPGTSTWQIVVCVQTVNGQASVTLNTTDRYAGDNYIVQASFDSWNTSNTTKALAETGVITAWKRVYIEKDKTFRQGGVLTANANQNDTTVTVYPWAILPACRSTPPNPGDPTCYRIAVFDSSAHTFEGAHDEPFVGYVTTDGSGNYVLHLVQADGITPYQLQYPYISSPYPSFGDGSGNASGNSAGVGVVGGGFYEADLGAIWQTYNDTFVEYWVPPDGAGAVPFLPQAWFDAVGIPERARFSQIWFNHYQDGGSGTPHVDLAHNYFHLLGASFMGNNNIGITQSSYDYTYIFVGSIEAMGTPAQAVLINQDTTSHELGHQFGVNYCSSGHDTRSAWCDGSNHCSLGGSTSQDCVMNSGLGQPVAQIEDGVSRFCVEDALPGDPNCSGTPRPGAVRTDVDPQ